MRVRAKERGGIGDETVCRKRKSTLLCRAAVFDGLFGGQSRIRLAQEGYSDAGAADGASSREQVCFSMEGPPWSSDELQHRLVGQ
jgi:hypothetical protein